MQRILAIATNTLRETNRNRVMYVLLLFAVMLILGSIVMGKLSLQQPLRIITDLGLAAISLFGVIIAVYLGVTTIHSELERKTVFFIIPKPLRRTEFVLGKFAGVSLTLLLQVVVMFGVFLGVRVLHGGGVSGALLKAFVLIAAEVLLVLSVALLLSSVTGPILAGFLSMGLFVLGRSMDFITTLLARSDLDGFVRGLLSGAYYVVPDYHLFAVSGAVQQGMSIHGEFLTWHYVLLSVGYGLLYGGVVLTLTVLRFRRKDFV